MESENLPAILLTSFLFLSIGDLCDATHWKYRSANLVYFTIPQEGHIFFLDGDLYRRLTSLYLLDFRSGCESQASVVNFMLCQG